MVTRAGFWAAVLVGAFAVTGALGADVTLDLNGFPNLLGGRLTGPGLATPVAIEAGAAKVELKGLTAKSRYFVDFVHSSGEFSGDFHFTVNDAGSGVAKVEPSGKVSILKGFEPGATTLTLNTHTITYNASKVPLGPYLVTGLCKPQKAGTEAVKLVAIPSQYKVDNLFNPGGSLEDFSFIVDSDGNVQVAPGFEEYIQARGPDLDIRTAVVRFRIESSREVSRRDTHALAAPAVTENGVTQVDMIVPVGGGGINIASFGPNTVVKSDAVDGFGKPLQGRESKNDFHFRPRLRYDVAAKTFYFDTTAGRAQSVSAEVLGMNDAVAPLSATVTATVLNPVPAAASAK